MVLQDIDMTYSDSNWSQFLLVIQIELMKMMSLMSTYTPLSAITNDNTVMLVINNDTLLIKQEAISDCRRDNC